MSKRVDAAPQKPESKKGKNTKLKNASYIVLIVLLLALAAGGAYARYVYKNANTGYVAAREFYFTSDHLSAEGETYTLSPGTTSVTFILKNYADDLRFSSDDITYSVTTTDGTLSVNGTTIESGVAQTNTPLIKQVKSEAAITLSGLENGKEYTVTATGTAGYKETLRATFTVLSAANVYKHLDTSNPAYVVLTVWTKDVAGAASITFPDGLIPDATDPALTGVKNYTSGGLPYEYTSKTFEDTSSFTSSYSSHRYRFFKEKTTDSYALEQFTTVVDKIPATEAIP